MGRLLEVYLFGRGGGGGGKGARGRRRSRIKWEKTLKDNFGSVKRMCLKIQI